ncbi:MAG: hypothetical protein M1827_000389 [Pycnora praestabilis]|nr:MAG: hypothetical protein M1827_000389 [Pycnora praestabilis]
MHYRYSFASLAPLASIFLGNVDAFWRLNCLSTQVARVDPLVNSGTVGDHAHTLHGASNFGEITTYDDLVQSNCTTCAVTQDRSSYWTPALYFQYPNGTAVKANQDGGMLAYYFNDRGPNITAFPKGFAMISGNNFQRNFTLPIPDNPYPYPEGQGTQAALAAKSVGFNCLNYQIAPEASLYRHFMPDKDYLDANCKDGLRLELAFPSCWNQAAGLNPPDHKSHMAYLDQVLTGTCPEGFNTQLATLFYETKWDTQDFIGVDGEFVIANGDPTGNGYHGDFMTGWDPAFLQTAINTCNNPSGNQQDCPVFNIQSTTDMNQCKIPVPSELADENTSGPRSGLPGNVPIQSGPGLATAGGSALPTSATASPTSKVVPTLSYSSGSTLAASSSVVPVVALKNADFHSPSPSASSTSSSFSSSSPAPSSPPSNTATSATNAVISSFTTIQGDQEWVVDVVEQIITVTAGDGSPSATTVASSSSTPAAAYKKHRRHVQRHVGERRHGGGLQ